jgi:DNA repair exonuclease SbcCD ATPase subunit
MKPSEQEIDKLADVILGAIRNDTSPLEARIAELEEGIHLAAKQYDVKSPVKRGGGVSRDVLRSLAYQTRDYVLEQMAAVKADIRRNDTRPLEERLTALEQSKANTERLEAKLAELEQRLAAIKADTVADVEQRLDAIKADTKPLEVKIADVEQRLAERPGLRYEGVYLSGKRYGLGDAVTEGGSLWICVSTENLTPGPPGKDFQTWKLAVKKGRDARDEARHRPSREATS